MVMEFVEENEKTEIEKEYVKEPINDEIKAEIKPMIPYRKRKSDIINIVLKRTGDMDVIIKKIENSIKEVKDMNEQLKLSINKFEEDISHIDLNRINTGQLLITTNTSERPFFDDITNINKDIPGYDRIRVFEMFERISTKLNLINDGPDNIYAILCRDGYSWSESETLIYPGEKWIFFDVYELRIRSPTQANKYRITEDDVSTSKWR